MCATYIPNQEFYSIRISLLGYITQLKKKINHTKHTKNIYFQINFSIFQNTYKFFQFFSMYLKILFVKEKNLYMPMAVKLLVQLLEFRYKNISKIGNVSVIFRELNKN